MQNFHQLTKTNLVKQMCTLAVYPILKMDIFYMIH